MNAKSQVCLLISVHNRKKVTLSMLSQLESFGYLKSFQTMVIDNGSSDGKDLAIQKYFPKVTILKGNEHL